MRLGSLDRYADQFDIRDEADLRLTLRQLWVKRWWIAASALVFMCLFGTAAFLIAPRYRASAVMISAGTERQGLSGSLAGSLGSLGGLASLAGINLGGNGGETEEALAVLRSRQFTDAFIRDKQLMPKLFARIWDARTQSWKPGRKPPTIAKAAKYFDKSIRAILQDKKTGLVTLQIDWKDPGEAAAWANEMVQRLNAEMRARARAKTDASVGYLEKELNTTTVVSTREAINRLIEVQIRQRMLANVTAEFAFRVVDPALPADKDDPVWPQKPLWIVAGAAVGISVAVFGVLLYGWFREGSRAQAISREKA